MTETTIDPTDLLTAELRFGVEITAPDGTTTVEDFTTLLTAINHANGINRTWPGTAHVVYWTEQHGPWSDDLTGNAFGTRIEWPDGRIEYEPADTRLEAEGRTHRRNTYRNAGEQAVTVSRAEVIDKPQRWPAQGEKPTGYAVPRPPARRPWQWWIDGWLFTVGMVLLLVGLVPTPLPDAVEALALVAGWLCLTGHVVQKVNGYYSRA